MEEPTGRITGIFLSSGVQLVWETDLYREGGFEKFGFTMRGFRRWLKALGVPRMRTPGGKCLVDLVTLYVAIRAVMRIGQPDFLCPGCKEISRGKRQMPPNTQVELDLEYFAGCWEDVCNELLYAQRVNWQMVTEAHSEAFQRAARRISLALAQQMGEARKEVVRTIAVRGRRKLESIEP